MKRPRDQRLPLSLYVIMAHAVLTQGSILVVRPTISYRAIEIGLSTPIIGVLAATFTLLPLLVAIPIGRVIDQFGERRLMLVGSVGMVVAVLLIVGAGSDVIILAVASVLLGVTHLAVVVGQQSMVGRVVPGSRLAAGYAYYTLTGSMGQAIAPGLIAAFGVGRTIPDTQAIFAVTLGFVGVATFIPLLLPKEAGDHGKVDPGSGTVRSLLRIRGLPTAIVVSGVVLAAIDVFTVYLPVIGAERGMGAGLVSLLLMIRAVASILSRIFLEPMQSALGGNRLLVLTVALACLVMVAIPVTSAPWLLCILMLPLGLGLGLAQPITMAWIAAISPIRKLGSAMSLRMTGNRLGQTIMPIVAGAATTSLGAASVLWIVAISLGGAAVGAMKINPVIGHDDRSGSE